MSLRILFNSLKDNGRIFIETLGVKTQGSTRPIAIVEGSMIHQSGSKEQLNRTGWNYFIPSPSAVVIWVATAGFEDIAISESEVGSRIECVATRCQHKEMLRAGLSRSDIR